MILQSFIQLFKSAAKDRDPSTKVSVSLSQREPRRLSLFPKLFKVLAQALRNGDVEVSLDDVKPNPPFLMWSVSCCCCCFDKS